MHQDEDLYIDGIACWTPTREHIERLLEWADNEGFPVVEVFVLISDETEREKAKNSIEEFGCVPIHSQILLTESDFFEITKKIYFTRSLQERLAV